MESFERRDFVIWRGAGGDAARAPLASRDAVESARDQVQAIAMHDDRVKHPISPGLDVFSIKSLPAKEDRL